MRHNSQIALSGFAACLLLGACKDPYCENNSKDEIKCPPLRVTLNNPLTKVKGKDNSISLKIENVVDAASLTASLSQQNNVHILGIENSGETDYNLNLPTEIGNFKTFRIGNLDLNIKESVRGFAAQINLIKPLNYQSATVFTMPKVEKADQPVLEFMGSGSGIFGLMSGFSGDVANNVRVVRRYVFKDDVLSASDMPEFFTRIVTSTDSSTVLIAVTANHIYLSHNPILNPKTAYKCSTSKVPVIDSPDSDSACKQLGFTLPMGTKNMLVTADESRIVLGDQEGNLSWCKLGEQTLSCPNMIGATGAGVLATLEDLNHDQKQDLLAAWSVDGALKVAVYPGTEEGFATQSDATLSRHLSDVMGQGPIDALAVGDIDGDGFGGDVVIGRGREVKVLQNQLEKYEAVWSELLDMTKVGPKINAIAVTRLDSKSTPDKPMDLLVSSNTAYDGARSTLYIHVFRPQ